MQNYKAYIDFIKFSIGGVQSVPQSIRDIDWEVFFEFCKRQCILGLVFQGIERDTSYIPRRMLLKWIGYVVNTKNLNSDIDKKVYAICKLWNKYGYESCILKGQANAMMYPSPEKRVPGDIDVWVRKKEDRNGVSKKKKVMDIIRIAQEIAPSGHYSLHHVTLPVFRNTPVEVHYRPVFLNNWWIDKRLQHYIDTAEDAQFGNKIRLSGFKSEISTPTDEFNAIFMLLHMWHHLLSTRNNMKQLIDYYYLLKRAEGKLDKEKINRLFHQFGVMRYARGIMWVEANMFGLDEKCLLTEPDEKMGRLLMRETLNFNGKRKAKKFGMSDFLHRIAGNLHLLFYFPMSVIIDPIYLVWHQWWKYNMKKSLKGSVAL